MNSCKSDSAAEGLGGISLSTRSHSFSSSEVSEGAGNVVDGLVNEKLYSKNMERVMVVETASLSFSQLNIPFAVRKSLRVCAKLRLNRLSGTLSFLLKKEESLPLMFSAWQLNNRKL